jgi:hypothetical protein
MAHAVRVKGGGRRTHPRRSINATTEGPGAVALRTFTDSSGITWTVWDTVRTSDNPVRETLAGGWLTFESPNEKRRLAPVPFYWAKAPDGELEQLLARAKPVTAPRGASAVRRRDDASGGGGSGGGGGEGGDEPTKE